MPEHTSHDSEAITLLAENVGEIREAVTELKEERVTLEASRAVLEAAIKGLGALRTQVLENDIGKLQLALNDKTRELAQEIGRFEAAVAEIDRRAEAGDDALKQQLAAESKQLHAEAASLRTQLAAYQEWGSKVELSLKEHAEKLAAIPATIQGAEGRSPNPRGKYESGVKYARLDIAEIAGSSYISAEDDNDEKPSPNSKKWKLMARRGGGGGASNDINALSGTAAISQGGTGQTTAILAARALLDGISTARGTILYRGASGWTTLAPSTAGYFLSTQGAGADPIFTAASGSGLGDFSGPASSTDNEIVRFDGAGGKNGQTSGLTIGDVASTNITISPIAANNLTLAGGSSGASLVLGQGTSGAATFNRNIVAGSSVTGVTSARQISANAGSNSLHGQFTAQGTDGTDTIFVSLLSGISAGNGSSIFWSSAATTGLRFAAATSADATGYAEKMRITTTGNLLVGGTTDITGSGGLKVFGTTAATSTTTGAFQCAGGASVAGALHVGGAIACANTVNAVSPTSPNRTITMVIGGTTYYLHAKTTND